MMGLALGVDYALLMVSRFREELATGAEPDRGGRDAPAAHAGRTVVFAGSTLLLSMLVSLFILPGSLLVSLAGTVMMVVVLSVAVATIVGPAILTLVGTNVDRWRIGPAPGDDRSRLMSVRQRGAEAPGRWRRSLIGGVLLVLAAPAIGLKTGPPSPEQLAKDAPARQDAEQIDERDRPRLGRALPGRRRQRRRPDHRPARAWRRSNTSSTRLAKLPGVQAVIGPQRRRPNGSNRCRNSATPALASEGNIGPVKQLGQPRPQPERRRRRGRRSCAKGSPKPATAPGCWRSAPTGPARGRS